jgi:hypothetical protein
MAVARKILAVALGWAVMGANSSPAGAASPERHICTDHQVVNGGTFAFLVVPDGYTCTINRVTVGTTGTNADPLTQSTELNVVHSMVTQTVNPEGMAVNVIDSSLTDDYRSVFGGASSLAISHSVVTGSVGGDPGDPQDRYGSAGALTIKQSVIAGPMRLYGSRRAIVEGSHVTLDDVELLNYASVLFLNSSFAGDVGVANSPTVNMCNVHATNSYLAVTQTPANGHVVIGATASGTCSSPTVVVIGKLYLQNNADTDPIDLKHVIIVGDLICTGNATAPRLEDVTVTGRRTGQCAK